MKKNDRKLINIAIFTMLVMIICMSLVMMEVIKIMQSEKTNQPYKPITQKVTTTIPVDLSDKKFNELILDKEPKAISNICAKGCNIKINMYNMDYYYLIKFVDNTYYLDIVKDQKLYLKNKNLGHSLESAYFTNYMNYILFYNVIEDGTYLYDYANTIDNRPFVDEFSSLENGEMKFTDEGIIYYYDSCYREEGEETNAKKIKAIRKPFSSNTKSLDTEYKNYAWCE